MSSDYTVGDLVAEFLNACGVTTVFGIASVHNIPMLDAIGRRNTIRFMMARGELGGAHMADGYARTSQSLGVLFSSTGPGAANAIGGLIEARFAGSPVLHITGHTASKFADRGLGTVHDPYDQLGMMASVCKSAYRIRSAQNALGVLTQAAVDALSAPMGPVSVEVPIDLQRAKLPRPAMLDHFVLPVRPARRPTDIELDELAARVIAAKRPMLWLGNGAKNAGAAARKLLAMGFGMVSSFNGRGTVPEDHPRNLGALTGSGMPVITDFYKTVDLCLVVGCRLRGHETNDFNVKLPDNLVQIDTDPEANGRTYPNQYFVCGDSQATLDALVERIEGRLHIEPGYAAEFEALKRNAQAAYIETLGAYGTFSPQLRAAMPKDAVWVRDVTQNNTTWGNRMFPLDAPNLNVYPVGAGIGQGLCLGIGAAAAAGDRRTVVMTGDGGFFLNVGEIWTAVQERLDMTVIVMNDRGYGVIKRIQDATAGGRRLYADLESPEIEKLASISDIPYFRCTSADTFGATVAKALAIRGLTLVEVDMHAVGEFPAYFPFNQRPAQPA
ncbi:MAG TPA: thiamine pyrophosphate-binding protein [Rhodopila sp.]|uniref:thiamine pyrophosphate-binding protein n=1 Tax=Rhodopila sp. TaxID=2480087 RepID=UPI002BC78B02|nr:thiamine pyrophosphate-binding protein [Rhodopila sp.]HVY17572.1 thiamine pyrophosphate-binding protein [Rhodopila sp.]